MEFTCRTACGQKALTASSRALRKTIRAELSFLVRHWGWQIIALLVVGIWLSWETAWKMTLICAIIFGLPVLHWKGMPSMRISQNDGGVATGTLMTPPFAPTTFW